MGSIQTKNGINNTVALFLRKMIVIFFIIVLVLCSCYTVLYTVYDFRPYVFLLYLTFLQHVLWLCGFLYYKDMPIMPLIMMYLAYILVLLYPLICIYWNSGDASEFIWYLIVIVGAIAFQVPNIELWIFLPLGIAVSVFFFSGFFPKIDINPELMNKTSILTVVSTIVLSIFFAIVHTKMISIDKFTLNETLPTVKDDTENLEKEKALYNSIIKYLEETKAFRDPSFNTRQLAKALHTNTTYISKAINAGNTGNFNILLNNFRIDYAKSMLSNGALKKYTIDHIYAKAGYKHRSTFNTAFKSVTGMTPSDFVSQNNSTVSI